MNPAGLSLVQVYPTPFTTTKERARGNVGSGLRQSLAVGGDKSLTWLLSASRTSAFRLGEVHRECNVISARGNPRLSEDSE